MLKRLLTYSVVITTLVWSVGILSMPLSVGAAVSGDLIKLQCAAGAGVNDACKAVYYLGADGKRYVFPNEKTYKTWYSDFLGVKIISSTEMSSYAIGGNVTYRPGIKLVKINTDPKVYAVSKNGTLRWVTTADIAAALYGVNWAKTSTEDVSDAFFVNYTVGANITQASDYDKTAQTNGSTTINEDKGLTGSSVSTGTSLTVALAADTPATGLLLGNSVNNKFTKINLTASADGDIVISQLTIRRGGTVASDAAFSSVEILDGATLDRIGNTRTINSLHMAVFNQTITVPAGTTKSIYLAGNMGSLASYAGEIPSLDLYSVVLSGSAALIGTLPIVGNYQNLNGTITIGTLTLANGANNPSASTQKVGVTSYIVSGFKLTANSTEDFKVSKIRFNQGGSAADADVANLKLLIDDAVVGTVANPTAGYVSFDLSASPVTIAKGKSVQVDLKLDIEGGSNRTIRFDAKNEADISATGQLYGAQVKVAAGTGATADADPFWTAPVTTVSQGSLRIGPATLTAANVPNSSTQVVLGKFEFEAKGEAVDITKLPIAFTVTTSTGSLETQSTIDLTNVTVYDENGVIVAGPVDPVHKQYEVTATKQDLMVATSTDTITIPTGLHIYTVKGDLNSKFGSNDTIVARINPGQVTAKGGETALTITPTPSTDQSSATMTVQSAQLSVSLSSTPVAQSIVAGSKSFTFANVVLGTNSSGEDVKITALKVSVKCASGCSPSQFSSFALYDGATKLTVSNDPDSLTSTATTANTSSTSTFTLATPLILTKGTTKTLSVKADVSTAATSGTVKVGIPDSVGADHVTAKGNASALDAAITISVSDGPAMTLSSGGTLTITKDSSTPKTGLMPANTSGLTFAVFSASATNEPINIEKLYLTETPANSGGYSELTNVYIYNGSTLLASVSPTSTDTTGDTVLIDVTNNPIVVPSNSSVLLTVKVDTADSNYQVGSAGASGRGLALGINAGGDITAKGSLSGTTISSKTVSGATSNTQYLFRSVPTVTPNDDLGANKIAGGTLASGSSVPLYRFAVTASSAGPVGLYRVQFLVTTSTATTTNWFLSDGTSDVAATTTVQVVTDSHASDVQLLGMKFTSDGLAPSAGGLNIQPVIISAGTTKTFTLRGDLTCSIQNCAAASGATGGSVQIQLLGDTALPTTLPNSALTLGYQLYENSFIWGDYWRTPIQMNASTTATTTEQWSNGYLVAKDNGGKMDATSSPVTFQK